MTRRSAARPAAASTVAVRAAVVLVVLAAVPVLLSALNPAQAAEALRVVTVMNAPQGGQGAYQVVAQLDPPPLAPLPPDAASVTPSGGGRATLRPVLDLNAGTPTAFVVDGSSSGASALPQALSGVAGALLKLPSTNSVTVVADRNPPVVITSGTPAQGIQALTNISASGNRATAAALQLALTSLQPASSPSAGGQSNVRLIVLTTSGSAAKDGSLDAVLQEMQKAGVVLGVVGAGNVASSWSDAATSTGGLAVSADPSDASAAYDTLLKALQARYVVTFTVPQSVTQATLTLTSAGARLTAPVTLPAAGGSATASPSPAGSTTPPSAPTTGATAGGSSSTASGPGSRIWGGVAILLVIAAGIAALAALRLRGRTAGGGAEPVTGATDDDGTPLPGVRMFDVSDPRAPAEIDLAPPEQPYRGRHRAPGVTDTDDLEDDEDDEDDGQQADRVEAADSRAEGASREDLEHALDADTPERPAQDAVTADAVDGQGGNARRVKEAG